MEGFAVELVPGRLAYALEGPGSDKESTAKSFAKAFGCAVQLVSIESFAELNEYHGYNEDFGPLKLSAQASITQKLNTLVAESSKDNILRIVMIPLTANSHEVRSNMIGCLAFYVVVAGIATGDVLAAEYFPKDVGRCLVGFRDASPGLDVSSFFTLSPIAVGRGLEKAIESQFFDMATFDSAAYDHYEQVVNGDLNWMVPSVLLATSSPEPGSEPATAKLLRSFNVGLIIQLNEADYDTEQFSAAGITHQSIIFEDGSIPPPDAVECFLGMMEVAEQQGLAVALHCKAGLGRTGSLVCCYLISRYGFSGEEALAWCRLCRPGSVLGPQQQFVMWFDDQLRKKRYTSLESRGGGAQPRVSVVVPSPMIGRYGLTKR